MKLQTVNHYGSTHCFRNGVLPFQNFVVAHSEQTGVRHDIYSTSRHLHTKLQHVPFCQMNGPSRLRTPVEDHADMLPKYPPDRPVIMGIKGFPCLCMVNPSARHVQLVTLFARYMEKPPVAHTSCSCRITYSFQLYYAAMRQCALHTNTTKHIQLTLSASECLYSIQYSCGVCFERKGVSMCPTYQHHQAHTVYFGRKCVPV